MSRSVSVFVVLAGFAWAQSLTLPPGPVTPGTTVPVTVGAAPAAATFSFNGTPLYMLSSGGELVSPFYRTPGGATWFSTPSFTFGFPVPATGMGSFGSFVLYCPFPPGMANRIDVGAPTPGFPAIHSVAGLAHLGFGSHWIDPTQGSGLWHFLNTSSTPFTFGVGDRLRVVDPIAGVSLAQVSLFGITVPAMGRASIPLPVPAPTRPHHAIEVRWVDPVAGPQTRRHGVHRSSAADLFLPDGKVIPAGGSLEARLQFATVVPTAPLQGPRQYALLIGTRPGQTFANFNVIPLDVEPLVMASLQGQLGPFLVNSPGVPTPVPAVCGGYCAPGTGVGPFVAPGIVLNNPNIPALVGRELHLAGILFDSANVLAATQLEVVRIN